MSDATITSLQRQIMRLRDDLEAERQSKDRALLLASQWQSKAAVQKDELKRQAKQIEGLKSDKRNLNADINALRAREAA